MHRTTTTLPPSRVLAFAQRGEAAGGGGGLTVWGVSGEQEAEEREGEEEEGEEEEEEEGEFSHDLNEGLFRRIIANDLTALHVALGEAWDQGDDGVWEDAAPVEGESEEDEEENEKWNNDEVMMEGGRSNVGKRLSAVNPD
jgi:ribosomal protein L12E/L44/L45/RPP1/RPP2